MDMLKDFMYGSSVVKIIKKDGITAELVYLCIFYISRQEVNRLIQDRNFPGFSFQLDGRAMSPVEGIRFEVKDCGVRLVFK